ncbi:unnamed protein product [Vitrella brassicaformis CCMP3155]|uniref:DEAD/DEAH-box helicase domain-containing protein n=1 Tax=Vitrella brassicaformis (strain CCMP3155) TaxID=1169540 RepID=A0A0G4H1Z4_VITBC|nr:unnamed protein product [Vitrella brassicaformis CCMP3155]|eukprot:CEM37653.1 unnamed protein product [Vitrella brassicaformis CCMP3155]
MYQTKEAADGNAAVRKADLLLIVRPECKTEVAVVLIFGKRNTGGNPLNKCGIKCPVCKWQAGWEAAYHSYVDDDDVLYFPWKSVVINGSKGDEAFHKAVSVLQLRRRDDFDRRKLSVPSLTIGSLDLPVPLRPAPTADEEQLVNKMPCPYQEDAYRKALGGNLVLCVPTGGGKTHVAAMWLAKLLQANSGHMALFIVHRKALAEPPVKRSSVIGLFVNAASTRRSGPLQGDIV